MSFLRKMLLLVCGWLALLFLLALVFLWFRGYIGERNARARMLDELKVVQSLRHGLDYELRRDEDDSHLMLELDDGSWLVMVYWDFHRALPLRALTLAMDSDGMHYESRAHYCGKFTRYRQMLRMFEDARLVNDQRRVSYFGEELSKDEIHTVANTSDLESARVEMRKAGFVVVSAD